MFPRILSLLLNASNSSDLLTMFGDDPTRIFKFGSAFDKTRPYALYQFPDSDPENDLEGSCGIDLFRVIIDVYGDSDDTDQVETAAELIRIGLEPYGYFRDIIANGPDPVNGYYRVGLLFDIWWSRVRSST